MSHLTIAELFEQGARIGHVAGKERVGVYERFEYLEAGREAIKGYLLTESESRPWFDGYCYGYAEGASGQGLVLEHVKYIVALRLEMMPEDMLGFPLIVPSGT